MQTKEVISREKQAHIERLESLTQELTLDRVGAELSEIYFDLDFVNTMPVLTVAIAIPEVLYSMTTCELE